MRVALTITAGVLLLCGCREPPGFACSSDDQCMSLSGNKGRCFQIGACGYLDPACASGYRYSGDAPKPWANACVVPDDVGGSTSSSDPSTTDAESTGETSTGEAASSSTGPTPPQCGNGMIELGELCDDGNDREADGCNPDCRPSGVLLFNFSSDLEGDDQAEAAMLTEDGDIVVGGLFGPSGERDGYVTRFRPDGAAVWTRTVAGSANRNDAIGALAPSPAGGIRALGQIINEVPPTKKMKKVVTPREDFWITEFDATTGDTLWSFVVGEAPPSSERGYGMVTLPEGDILIAGRVGDPSNSDFGVIRFSVVDEGKGGMVLNTVWGQTFDGGLGLRDFAEAIAYDPAGRIIAGGTMEYEAADLDRHLRALDLDGNGFEPPCEDLGGDDDLAADDRIFAVAVGPSGEVVAAGRATRETEESTDAWLGYYPPGSCTLEWVETEPGPGQDADAFTTVAVDDLGNIVAAGFLNSGNTEDAWLAKYDSTGEQLWAIDPVDGSGNGNDRIEAVVIGPGREITVAGRMTRPDEDDTWVARYTP